MTTDSADLRYAQMTRQLMPVAIAGAAAIAAMTFLSLQTIEEVARALVLQAAIMAFNAWFSIVLLPRVGPSAELGRLLVNVVGTIVLARYTGWPIAVWLWPSFVAIALDPLVRWAPLLAVLSMALPMGAVAVHDGVPWTVPLASLVFALFCCEIVRVRHAGIRDMLSRGDEQREALERAHASVQEGHAQLEREVESREKVEIELRSSQKLEAIGRLASGIAHEINTPVQFVGDSIHFVRDGISDLLVLVELCTEIRRVHERGGDPTDRLARLAAAEEAADLPYLTEHLPAALDRALDGVSRVAVIVRSMKQFAHPEQRESTGVDLNQSIEATLAIAKHEYKHVADVVTELAPIPMVIGHPGELNQVLLNIVVNAAHAIGDVVGDSGRRGRITVRTNHDHESVTIAITDTGGGIPQQARDKIFEPFFTTKAVGRGTGQGLAMSRSIVDRHGGSLTFSTEPGRTTFTIQVPIGTALANVA